MPIFKPKKDLKSRNIIPMQIYYSNIVHQIISKPNDNYRVIEEENKSSFVQPEGAIDIQRTKKYHEHPLYRSEPSKEAIKVWMCNGD